VHVRASRGEEPLRAHAISAITGRIQRHTRPDSGWFRIHVAGAV